MQEDNSFYLYLIIVALVAVILMMLDNIRRPVSLVIFGAHDDMRDKGPPDDL